MRKGIRNLCNGDGSTSTLDHLVAATPTPASTTDQNDHPQNKGASRTTTLEEMILELELEEEMARKAKPNPCSLYGDKQPAAGRRMSCVNNADILRSARHAVLSQYPRFSLDGRDAMYRNSFRPYSSAHHITSSSLLCSSKPLHHGLIRDHILQRRPGHPAGVLGAGEAGVVWCKPGVVARLMGLEAIPVPITTQPPSKHGRPIHSLIPTAAPASASSKETRHVTISCPNVAANCDDRRPANYVPLSSSSASKPARPMPMDPRHADNAGGGWPIRRFRF